MLSSSRSWYFGKSCIEYKKQNSLSVFREAISTQRPTKPSLGNLDLANAVNGCVHNEGDAVFISLLVFWQNVN
jgi:hypothetical protein